MEFDISKIEFSHVDRKRGLVLPKGPSKKLAEFIGILAGDGHVSFNTRYNIISVSGDSRLDYDYFHYVKNLIKNLFNINVKIIQRKYKNLIEINFSSLGLFNFIKGMGYYKHHSRNIKIPNWILNNQDYLLHTLKGLADTDFSLMLYRNRKKYPHYPVISLSLVDKKIIILFSKFLEKLGFNVDFIPEDRNFDKRFGKTWIESRLRLSGRQNLQLWMKLIGFRNQRHLNKYEEYLKSGTITSKKGRPPKIIKGLKKSGAAGI